VNRRSAWLAIREPLTQRRATALKVGSFLLPLLIWCIVSYVPFVWHPMVKITDAGDSDVFVVGQRFTREFFASENARLIKEHSQPGTGFRANPVFLPAPHEVFKAFFTAFVTPPYSKGDPWLHQTLWHSIQIIFWGFVTSAIVGVPLGVLCGTFDFFAKLTEPFIDFIRYMPAPAFGALCIALLGIADAPKIAIIWIGTFFQMVLVVANTTRLLDIGLLEAAQTLGASRPKLLTRVILPGILPNLYNDMRILIGWAWTYLIVAELIGESSGISWFINQQGKHFRFDNVFAGIIMIGIIGLACDQFLAAFGRYLFPYLPQSQNKTIITAIFGAFLFLPQRMIIGRSHRRHAARREQEAHEQPVSKPLAPPIDEPTAQERSLADVSVS
jgi:NitT/TauT family transport system permease protein